MPSIDELMATCPLKQHIRKNLWETYILKLAKKPIKYLTLYSPPLIDVKHFAREGYINLSDKMEYSGVVGVTLPGDNERAHARAISEGKGRLRLLKTGYIHELITNGDKELTEQFPFDVINLDYCNHIFGDINTDDLSDNLQDIEQIIKCQAKKNIPQFVIFITTRTDKHSSANNTGFAQTFIDALGNKIQRNIDLDAGFKNKYHEIFNNLTVQQVHTQRYTDFISVGIVKLVLMGLTDKGYYIDDLDISFLKRDDHQPTRELLHLALSVSRYTGHQGQTLRQYGRVSYSEKGSTIVLDKVKNNKIVFLSESADKTELERIYGNYLKDLSEDTFEIRTPKPVSES